MFLVAFQVRTLVQKSFKAALDENDILISPAAPSAAYKIGMPNEILLSSLLFVNWFDFLLMKGVACFFSDMYR